MRFLRLLVTASVVLAPSLAHAQEVGGLGPHSVEEVFSGPGPRATLADPPTDAPREPTLAVVPETQGGTRATVGLVGTF